MFYDSLLSLARGTESEAKVNRTALIVNGGCQIIKWSQVPFDNSLGGFPGWAIFKAVTQTRLTWSVSNSLHRSNRVFPVILSNIH